MRKTVLALALMFFGAATQADVTVKESWVRGTTPAQKATGAFMEITSSEAASLLSASSPVAGVVELHTMSMDDGVMRMRPVPKIDLPAGKAVELKPGGYHVMLMDLKQPLKTGDIVPITLKVEGKDKSLSTLDVKAEVKPLNAAAPAADMHQHHKH